MLNKSFTYYSVSVTDSGFKRLYIVDSFFKYIDACNFIKNRAENDAFEQYHVIDKYIINPIKGFVIAKSYTFIGDNLIKEYDLINIKETTHGQYI